MRALRFSQFGDLDALAVEEIPQPAPAIREALVRVAAAGINPSDAKNVLGRMPQTTLPRTPGRDYAGTVVHGPVEWMGAEVWGSGGDLGFTRDGTHAGYVVVPIASLARKPSSLSMVEAGAAGVPYVTAFAALRAAGLGVGETLLVVGGTGAVGEAAAHIARWSGARVIATARGAQKAASIAHLVDGVIDLERSSIVDGAAALSASLNPSRIGGRGPDVVLNAVGGETFGPSAAAMARGGRLVAIAATGNEARFDLLDFYRREKRFIGLDTLGLDAAAASALLERLRPGFESGVLRVKPSSVAPLADARRAYAQTLAGGGKYVLSMA